MAKLKITSWNVNGLRAIKKKGLFEWFERDGSDILCLQETKIQEDQLTADLIIHRDYHSYFSHAERKGYSGVAVYTREKPLAVRHGMGIKKFDCEGRTLVLDYGDFTLLNIYFPNGKASEERLQYKLNFYDAFLKFAQKLRREGKKLVICGDFNTAHKPIDLAHPKRNEMISGFLPVERAWMDKFTNAGYLDTFRLFNDKPENYTWWHMVTQARARNVGWRIDYFFASEELEKNLAHAAIEPSIMGSDHCPVNLVIRT
ncbi:MAG TPA: exodeoxyribonuclease III [Candidatus Obscuribacterales bacterium]